MGNILMQTPVGVGAYQAALSASYYPMKLQQTDRASPFSGELLTRSIGTINLTHAHASAPFRAVLSPEPTARDKERLIILLHQDGGPISFRRPRAFDITPGSMVLMDTSQRLETEQRGAATAL